MYAYLQLARREYILTRMTYEERPWGSFTVLDEAQNYKVKRIEVLSQKRLSYQKHSKRAEHWMVVEGVATITLDGREYTLHPGQTIDIPIGSAHRVGNAGPEKLIFIEIQRGAYLGEDDSQKIYDKYFTQSREREREREKESEREREREREKRMSESEKEEWRRET